MLGLKAHLHLLLGMGHDVSGLRHMVLVASGFLLVLFALKVNLDLGMRKDVSGLRHMVLVARGFLLVVFAFKEPYKYGCNIPL